MVDIRKYNLREEQPHLWQRVLALSVLFILAGIPLLIAPSPTTPSANISIMSELLALKYHGIIFIIIGIILFITSFFHKKNYSLLRGALSIALGYMIMWLLSLIYGGLTGRISGLAIASYQGFITYIILNTLRDPGFKISDLIREVRKHHDA